MAGSNKVSSDNGLESNSENLMWAEPRISENVKNGMIKEWSTLVEQRTLSKHMTAGL
jgi:hypothetical protein